MSNSGNESSSSSSAPTSSQYAIWKLVQTKGDPIYKKLANISPGQQVDLTKQDFDERDARPIKMRKQHSPIKGRHPISGY